MPVPHPPEFRRRAVELARTGDKSVSALAKSLGISQSCLSNWIRQAAVDEGRQGGLTTAEKKEMVELRLPVSECSARSPSRNSIEPHRPPADPSHPSWPWNGESQSASTSQ
ncbi:transposase [Spirillospora sp. NPDC048911]|uniref:transposase n=1 Tax=Spirillospora sp. NPDC048911 TaxID=3364527 RepID=UPI00371DE633